MERDGMPHPMVVEVHMAVTLRDKPDEPVLDRAREREKSKAAILSESEAIQCQR